MDNVVGLSVQIHPVALFAMVDCHERRPEAAKRVIGTLMGVKDKGVVEVRAAYTVPHNETEDEVAIDMMFDKDMMKLHQRVNPLEVVLGWFLTSADITLHTVLIHDYYSRLDPNAIFVTIDTGLTSGRLEVKAHVKSRLGLPGKTEGIIFTPVPSETVCFEPERVGVTQLIKYTSPEGKIPVLSRFGQIERAAEALDDMLAKVLDYIESVTSGKTEGDSSVGRLLLETLSRIPQVEPAKYEAMVNSLMQDMLMIVYLSNLTKTQLTLGEKLSQITAG